MNNEEFKKMLNMEYKNRKLKIPSEDRTFSVDPTRFALVSLLVKGRILLHKPILSDFKNKTKTPKMEAFV